ncbi:hypothetical protein AOL_s00006g512 [Orbilia oligospora ATCC 24927]|uniref:Uncharacterized protein n=1 Tax=Arthrobotrys oligospora (strain ATCC 24927 / CBS 115.81 / DSM 1491) TaxID=756982 RepID=G1X0W1_ARTOA|nr:hypothetical protein AOL_s00006g512 [Orbilia oligospora ATCC 24927]EGX53251.1 hypothetical protein AOL_s00006g512 [Orbilia oligospora ATCC 24927]
MLYTLPRLVLSALLLGSAINGAAIPDPEAYNGSQLEERTACNADNLLRLIRGQENLAQGLEFCSSWLGKVHTTVTVVGKTITPTITTTEVSTSTSTHLLTETATITNTDYSTITNTKTVIVTRLQTVLVWNKVKRTCKTKKPLSEQILSSTYPPSRISSACNCLTIEPGTTSTVYLTQTAAPVTSSVIIPSVTETSFTITDTVAVTTTLTQTDSATTSKTTVSWVYITI